MSVSCILFLVNRRSSKRRKFSLHLHVLTQDTDRPVNQITSIFNILCPSSSLCLNIISSGSKICLYQHSFFPVIPSGQVMLHNLQISHVNILSCSVAPTCFSLVFPLIVLDRTNVIIFKSVRHKLSTQICKKCFYDGLSASVEIAFRPALHL
jgi:hypothetical protein